MDLRALEQQDTTEYELTTPAGDKTDIVFTLAGQTHPIRAALERKMRARSLREFNKKGKTVLPDDPDTIQGYQIDRLVACTIDWRGMEMDGVAYLFSAENARALFENDRFGWLRDQVDGALQAGENFIKPQSAN